MPRTRCPELLELVINDPCFELTEPILTYMQYDPMTKECLLVIGRRDFDWLDKFCNRNTQKLIDEVKEEILSSQRQKSARK